MIPADTDLNAGNVECEGLSIIIDGNAYSIFLTDDLLTFGPSNEKALYAFHENTVWYLSAVWCGIIAEADKNTLRLINWKNAIVTQKDETEVVQW